MPELAEVKIMSEYINYVSDKTTFNKVKKSPQNKNPELVIEGEFKIKAHNRGKELLLQINDKKLLCNMGMSGNWVFLKKGNEPKHSHLMFDTTDGYTLALVDFRRFSRWKWVEGWSGNRGPCMLTEWDDFVTNLKNNSDKKIFDKPIYELMLDQKYFNGLGNYLRAEILDRSNQNPFVSSREAINNQLMLELCRDIVMEAYQLGGGQLLQWTNPYFDDKVTFRGWLQCYGKKEKIVDSKGRTFWFDEKYKTSLT
jgi:endonuclease VIII-like 1